LLLSSLLYATQFQGTITTKIKSNEKTYIPKIEDTRSKTNLFKTHRKQSNTSRINTNNREDSSVHPDEIEMQFTLSGKTQEMDGYQSQVLHLGVTMR